MLLVISLPLMAIAWTLVRLTSKGPAIFRQVRVGREGQPFTAYKFRTMKLSSESDEADDLYTRENDLRVTRVGRWLRKLRIDELPQDLVLADQPIEPRHELVERVVATDFVVERALRLGHALHCPEPRLQTANR